MTCCLPMTHLQMAGRVVFFSLAPRNLNSPHSRGALPRDSYFESGSSAAFTFTWPVETVIFLSQGLKPAFFTTN